MLNRKDKGDSATRKEGQAHSDEANAPFRRTALHRPCCASVTANSSFAAGTSR